MNMKKEIVLELQKGENVYRFSMPENAPLGEIYDVGFQILKSAAQLAQDAIQQAQNQLLPKQEITPEVVLPEEVPVVSNCDTTSNCESVGT